MLRRTCFFAPTSALCAFTSSASTSANVLLTSSPRPISSTRFGSFATQIFDGRIDYTELFPYPTCDRTQTEAGAVAIKNLIHSSSKSTSKEEGDNNKNTNQNDEIDPRAILAAQMPKYSPVPEEQESTTSQQKKEATPQQQQQEVYNSIANASNTSQDTAAWLTQKTFQFSRRPHDDISGKLATHLCVGSYLLRSLAPEFSPEVQNVAAGKMNSVVLVGEQVSGSYVAANATKASYDDERIVYSLSGEKYIPSWNYHSSTANNNKTQDKLLLVLARAETQITTEKGETEMAQRLAWFPVDLSLPEVKATVTINNNNNNDSKNKNTNLEGGEGGVTIKFSNTPVPGGNVLGAIGDGFRHNQVATLSTHHIASASIVGLVSHTLKQLSDLSCLISNDSIFSSSTENNNNNNHLVSTATLNLLRAKTYALESTTYAFATNLDRQMSDTIIESACLAISAYSLARDVRSLILNEVLPNYFVKNEGENTGNNTNNNNKNQSLTFASQDEMETSVFLQNCADSLFDMMSALGHPDHMSLLAACCGVEDYGLKMNKRPTFEFTQLRTQRALGVVDKFPSPVICQNEAKGLEKQIVKFATAIHSVFVNNGPAVLYRQSLLSDIGHCAALMYLSSCSLARANRCAASKQKQAATEEELTVLYFRQTSPEIDQLLEKIQTEGIAPSRLTHRMSRFCLTNYSSAAFVE